MATRIARGTQRQVKVPQLSFRRCIILIKVPQLPFTVGIIDPPTQTQASLHRLPEAGVAVTISNLLIKECGHQAPSLGSCSLFQGLLKPLVPFLGFS